MSLSTGFIDKEIMRNRRTKNRKNMRTLVVVLSFCAIAVVLFLLILQAMSMDYVACTKGFC